MPGLGIERVQRSTGQTLRVLFNPTDKSLSDESTLHAKGSCLCATSTVLLMNYDKLEARCDVSSFQA